MMSELAFAEDYILTWEDGGSTNPSRTLSLDPADSGNWSSGIRGVGLLVGSQHGVTAITLAHARNCPVEEITEQVMRDLSLADAAQIAITGYYKGPGLDRLPWDQVIASVMDFGWGAGPRQGVMLLQRAIGVAADGAIGMFTLRAYQQWIASHSLEGAATIWATKRNDYYQAVVRNRPVNQKFLHGWMRRTAYFLPDGAWWAKFEAGH